MGEPGAVAPRISAAVMLTRVVDGELEVFFARRSPALRFFGGAWAFPGGVRDDLDEELAAADGQATETGGLLACGLRELFEELGVLAGGLTGIELPGREGLRADLGRRGGPTPEAEAAWRAFCEPVAGDGALLAGLRPIGLITTPAFRPLRYRTLFLHAELPAGETPTVVEGELVDGRFARPAHVLRAWERGEHEVVPPVLFLLELLAKGLADAGDPQAGLERFFESAGEAMEHIARGRLHSAFTSPGILAAPLRTPTLPPAMTTNTYLVGTEHVFVIDPGTYDEGERARLFDTLDRWQADGRRIAGVLLTHQHGDHVGSASAVCARYDVPLFAHAETLAILERRWNGGEVPSLMAEAGVTPRALGTKPADVRAIEDGHVFELGASPDGRPDWQLVARHTPGHARGHLVFVDARYGTQIVGDMASTISTIVIDPPEGDLAEYLDSLRAMLAWGAESEPERQGEWNLLPAHGPWTSRGAALVERYLSHRAEREASLLRGLAKGFPSRRELVGFVYADTDERLWPVAERSLLAGLHKLAAEGHAVPAAMLAEGSAFSKS